MPSNRSALFIYTVLNVLIWFVIFVSRGMIKPHDYHLKQYWTWRPSGERPWIFRLLERKRGSWYSSETESKEEEIPRSREENVKRVSAEIVALPQDAEQRPMRSSEFY
jgi:AGZA family xanthine/uracil permease-like MFS transporter